MSTQLQMRLRQEAEIIQRFSGSYGKQFEAMIVRLNGHATATDAECLRMCVEAINMVLNLQGHLAEMLGSLSRESTDAELGLRRLRAA